MIQEVIVRAGTAAEWADADSSDGAAGPVLAAGELGIVTDKRQLAIGDGTNRPASLSATGRATLVGGTKVVNDARVTATSVILLTAQSLGTVSVAKPLAVTARSAGTSFTITSADGTDTSVVGYTILEP